MGKFTVALRLFIITAVAAVCLALAYKVTAPITEVNNEKAFNESLREAIPNAKSFKAIDLGAYEDETITINSVNVGYEDEKQEKVCGYVVTVTSSEGYGGELCVMVGIDKDLRVTKVIISSPFAETPGLGAKAKEPKFIDQYSGQKGPFEIVKREASAENEISAITSATITSKAVNKCVNTAVEIVSNGAKKSTEKGEEAKDAYNEKKEQSEEEIKEIEEKRKDEETPQIKPIDEKEEGKNE